MKGKLGGGSRANKNGMFNFVFRPLTFYFAPLPLKQYIIEQIVIQINSVQSIQSTKQIPPKIKSIQKFKYEKPKSLE